VSIDWVLSQKFFNTIIKIVIKETTDCAKWLEKRRKKYEQFRSSSTSENFIQISRTSQFIRFTTSETSFRNKKSSRKLIRVSFKLSKNILKKTTKNYLKKNKDKELSAQFKKITKSSIDSSKNLAESSDDCFTNSAESSSFFVRDFTESFENISLSEKTRDEISKVILQKLKNRHSETFQNHKESFHSIIFSFFSEAKITSQHLEQVDQNMQKMIQAIIREMMSKMIQQSVTTTVNVNATTIRSNSFSASDRSQMISRTTSKSRSERWITFDIRFFDFMYDNKFTFTKEFIKHVDKDIYFRNVHLFLKRVKDVIRVKNVNQVRKNLFICLRELTLQWYISKLSENIKNLLKYDNEIEYWEKKLLKRFKKSVSVTMTSLIKKKYTMNDVKRRRKFRKYADVILRVAKFADLTSKINQIFLIYNEIDVKFQRNLFMSKIDIKLNSFLINLDDRKNVWWQLIDRKRSSENFYELSINNQSFYEYFRYDNIQSEYQKFRTDRSDSSRFSQYIDS
jgi:hypothetical protein